MFFFFKCRVRIGGTAGARPLRPGPRLNLRPVRLGSSSVAPPPSTSEAPVEQEPVTTPEPAAHPEGDTLTKLRSRPRLKVQPVVPQTRPFSNQRRPLIGNLTYYYLKLNLNPFVFQFHSYV